MTYKLNHKKHLNESIAKLRHIINIAESEINASTHEDDPKICGALFIITALAHTVLECDKDIPAVMERIMFKDVTPEQYKC